MLTRPSNVAVAAIVTLAAAAAASAQVGANGTAPDNPYTPPACVAGVPFADVTCTTPYDAWIEQFAADSITGGCGNGDYCPTTNVTRNQMAVFIERAMRGTANWSPGDLGGGNTGLGAGALINNTSYAQKNTALGYQALYTQSYANGDSAFNASNTAVGYQALYANQQSGVGDGLYNTAVGTLSLAGLASGSYVTALGYDAGAGQVNGSGDTYIGAGCGPAADAFIDAIAIGFNTTVDASNHVRIGDIYVSQIGGNVAWSNLSDARAKKEIRPLDLGLEFVMALRPVSFQLINGDGRTDMGFVAQDVEALLGDDYNVLGIGGDADRTLSLRYTDFIAPMVNAIQQQQAQIDTRDARITDLEARVATQQAAIDAQRAQVKTLMARLAAIDATLARSSR